MSLYKRARYAMQEKGQNKTGSERRKNKRYNANKKYALKRNGVERNARKNTGNGDKETRYIRPK